jgi:hypothetical protein
MEVRDLLESIKKQWIYLYTAKSFLTIILFPDTFSATINSAERIMFSTK